MHPLHNFRGNLLCADANLKKLIWEAKQVYSLLHRKFAFKDACNDTTLTPSCGNLTALPHGTRFATTIPQRNTNNVSIVISFRFEDISGVQFVKLGNRGQVGFARFELCSLGKPIRNINPQNNHSRQVQNTSYLLLWHLSGGGPRRNLISYGRVQWPIGPLGAILARLPHKKFVAPLHVKRRTFWNKNNQNIRACVRVHVLV